MSYEVRFPTRNIEKKFNQALSKIPQRKIQSEIMDHVEAFCENPQPFGQKFFKRLNPPVELYQITT